MPQSLPAEGRISSNNGWPAVEREVGHDIDIVLITGHARLEPAVTALAAMLDEIDGAGGQA